MGIFLVSDNGWGSLAICSEDPGLSVLRGAAHLLAKQSTWKSQRTANQLAPRKLFGRYIVTFFCLSVASRQSLGKRELHLNLVPFAVIFWAYRAIPEYVLIAQFKANLSGYACHIVRIVDRKHPSPGFFGDFTQKRGTDLLLDRGEIAIINADGIHEHIRFSHGRLNITFTVAAMVIAAIRYDQQRFSRVLRLSHLADPEIDCVQQGCAPVWFYGKQLALNVLD